MLNAFAFLKQLTLRIQPDSLGNYIKEAPTIGFNHHRSPPRLHPAAPRGFRLLLLGCLLSFQGRILGLCG
jgi:hypothetical protein